MLIKYSDNLFKQVIGIIAYNCGRLAFFVVISTYATLQIRFNEMFGWWILEIPVFPVTILGGALAIFLGFRNNSAYDRWWEARKIWGGIVNSSRTFATMIMSFASPHHSDGKLQQIEIWEWQKQMIYRHISWMHALRMHLRKKFNWDELNPYMSEEEIELIKTRTNKPVQLLNLQGIGLMEAFDRAIIEDFRHMELTNLLKEFYTLQGKAERIKNTIFPYYYNYFTRLFLWLFVICLPFTLIEFMEWGTIPMSVAISFMFSILEKSGEVTEDPFEGRAADTPMNTITRSIEIDLREMLGDEDIPQPMPFKTARFGVQYFD